MRAVASVFRPYNKRGVILVVQKDYRDFLLAQPPATAALVLTDPPYSISRKTGFSSVKNGVKRFAVSMDFGHWDHKPIDLTALAKGAFRSLRPGGTAIIWYDIWKLSHVHQALQDAGFKMLRLILWHKTNPVPLNSRAFYLSNSREAAVVGVKKGGPVFDSLYDSGDYFLPIPRHGGKRLHPTQKPLKLFEKLVLKHTKPGDLVLDPFAGSGTTLIAALKYSRRALAADIDPHYVQVAKKRISTKCVSGITRCP